jgi:(p)ppGpp synthase/HD superfamily hydrolase
VELNLEKVRQFCKDKHLGQTRKDGSDYHLHPFRVCEHAAFILQELALPPAGRPSDAEILAAALLHDTIEDCGCDYEDLSGPFGPRIADMAAALSDDKRLPEKLRLEEYRRTLRTAPAWVQAVKLADLVDNATDLPKVDDAAWKAKWIAKANATFRELIAVQHIPYARKFLSLIEAALH